MSNRLNSIQELRNMIMSEDDDGRRQDETKRIKFQKSKDVPKRKSRNLIEHKKHQQERRRVNRPLTKRAFEEWMSDVEEAVDQFIGMELDVLPVMPWKRWYKEGLSAVVAAKNAVQMYEDLEDDEEDFEEWEDEDEDEDEDIEEEDEEDVGELDELFGLGAMPYHKWYKKLAAIFASAGLSLVKAQDKLKIKNTTLHSWYNAGYPPEKVVSMLLKGGRRTVKATVEDVERITKGGVNNGLAQSLGGWASALGLKDSSPAFVTPSVSDDGDKFAEGDDSGDNGGAKAPIKDAVFGVNINELAERAQNVVKAKPRQFQRNGDPTKVREDPTEVLEHDKMLGIDEIIEGGKDDSENGEETTDA